MQNKPNFHKTEMSANIYTTKNYEIYADFRHEKTKPIQTQFNPKRTQSKPICRVFDVLLDIILINQYNYMFNQYLKKMR